MDANIKSAEASGVDCPFTDPVPSSTSSVPYPFSANCTFWWTVNENLKETRKLDLTIQSLEQ